MKCLNCGNKFEAKRATAKYCSDACRQRAKRLSVTEVSVTELSVTEDIECVTRPLSGARATQEAIDELESGGGEVVDFEAIAPDYIEYMGKIDTEQQARRDRRSNPDSLNYGGWMNADQLKEAKLTSNRAPIPGDSDYQGCCEYVDGRWVVKTA